MRRHARDLMEEMPASIKREGVPAGEKCSDHSADLTHGRGRAAQAGLQIAVQF